MILPADERFLAVSGDARARGLAQGRTLAGAVAGHYQALLASLARAGIAEPRAYLAAMLAETRFAEAIARHMPHLLDEVAGIADGAGMAFDEVYALQLLDEEWAYRDRRRAAGRRDKCSSLAVHDAAAGVTWIGQNMDLGPYTDGFQRAVEHRPDNAPAMLLLTIAGVIALLGVNAAGLGVCVNSLPQLPSAAEGIPVAFMIRRLLEAASAAEAADWCRALPHATNQHYLIADAGQIVSLECSAAGVTEYRAPDAERILHTNHPLTGEGARRYPAEEVNSVARLRSLERRLARAPIDEAALEGALTAFDDPAHPVCRLDDGSDGVISFTTGSMLSALRRRPAAVASRISFGPPSERGYHAFVLEPSA